MVSLTILAKVFTYYAALGTDAMAYPYTALPFFVWYPFFHVGFVIAGRVDLSLRRVPWLAISGVAILIGLVASLAEGFFWLPIDKHLAVTQVKISSSFLSLALFFAAVFGFAFAPGGGLGGLAWIGKSSYFVYLVHIIPLHVSSRQIEAYGWAVGTPAHILAVFEFTLIACIVGIGLGRAFLPAKLRPYLMG